jgi:MFS family permease
MNFISGMQIIGISIFTRVFYIQWGISQSEVISITSSIFIGAFVAQVFCMVLADKIGR